MSKRMFPHPGSSITADWTSPQPVSFSETSRALGGRFPVMDPSPFLPRIMRSIASLILFFACTILFAQAAYAGQAPPRNGEGMIKPLDIVWSGLPEGVIFEWSIFHPRADLHRLVVSDLGGRRGKITGMKSHVRSHRTHMRRAFSSLDLDRFELRDPEGYWVAKRVLNASGKSGSAERLPLEFRWQPAGILRLEGEVEPLRRVGYFTRKIEHSHPGVDATLRAAGSKESGAIPLTTRAGMWLDPGEYVVELKTPSHLAQVHRVLIKGGETTALSYQLLRHPKLRNVEIEVLLGAGPKPWMEGHYWGISIFATIWTGADWMEIVDFQSAMDCGVGKDLLTPIQWEKKGDGHVGRATIYDVPQGELTFQVLCFEDPTIKHESVLPNGDVALRITVLRGSGGPGWGFDERLDSNTIESRKWSLTNVTLYEIGKDHTSSELIEFYGGSAFIPDRVAEQPTRWAYVMDGFRPVFGTGKDFAPNGEGRRIASIELIPGTYSKILVVDEQGAPVPGASVFADGVEITKSDQQGLAIVDLPKSPNRLTIRSGKGSWSRRLIWGSLAPWLRAELKPDPETPPK